MHVHLREPGQEHKETIATGTRVGGRGRVHRRRLHAQHRSDQRPGGGDAVHPRSARPRPTSRACTRLAPCRLDPTASSSPRSATCAAAGCVAVSDDGRPVADGAAHAARAGVRVDVRAAVIDHCEDPSLKGDGVAHEGPVSGLARAARAFPAPPSPSWSSATSRWPSSRAARVHIAHMSARQSLRAVRAGKAARRQGHVRGHAASLHAHRRRAERARRVRHEHEDEPAAAGSGRPRRPDRGPARRVDRRHRDRPRAASRRREGARIRPRAVRHRRARDRGAALPRSAGARGRHRLRRASSSCCRPRPRGFSACPAARLPRAVPPTSPCSRPTPR